MLYPLIRMSLKKRFLYRSVKANSLCVAYLESVLQSGSNNAKMKGVI